MIINQDEINKLLDSKMLIFMIGGNYLHESIVANCVSNQDENLNRLKIVSLISPEALLYKKQIEIENKGLISLDWIRKTTTQRPCLIIMVYDVRNKLENFSWKEVENSYFSEISKVKTMDNYQYMNIIVLIYCNNNNFSFDTVNEDKERSYNIKKIVDPKNLFFINGIEGLKSSSKKITKLINIQSKSFYKNLKVLMKKKRTSFYDDKEKLIKYNVKLGILSQIKNKKPNSKYFEDAYNILLTLNYSNIQLYKFLEYKYVADWLFHQSVTIRSVDPQNSSFIIKVFDNHINFFSKKEIYENNKKFLIQEFMWKISRLEIFARFLEELYFSFNEKSYMNFPGHYYLLAAFNYCRINKIYPDILKDIDNYDFKFDFSKLKIVESKYFAKLPRYYVNVDPLTKVDIGFDDYIYTKLYLCTINQDKINSKILELFNCAQKHYKNFFLKDYNTMTIFFQKMIMNELHDTTDEKLRNYYLSFVGAKNLEKFPLLYLTFTNELKTVLIKENNPENYAIILQNIINISSVREISPEEEDLLLNIMFTDSVMQKRFDLPSKNKVFYFDYSLSNNNPKVFDSTIFQFDFNTKLRKEMKLHSITLVFNNDKRNKQYLTNNLLLNKEAPLNLCYNLLVKPSDDQLKLIKVRFEIHPENTKNILIFEQNIVNESEKTIQLKYTKSNIIDFNFLKKLQISSNQFYNFDINVLKKDPNIKISVLTIEINFSEEDIKPSSERTSSTDISALEKKSFKSKKSIEFLTFDNEGNIIGKKDNFSTIIKEIDNDDKINRNIIFKLSDLGNYTLKLVAKYTVLRNEIYDDFSNFTYSEYIQIDCIPVVSSKTEFLLDNYFTSQNQKIFPTHKDIKFKLRLENKINNDIHIKKMEIISPNQDITITSQLSAFLENEVLFKQINENMTLLKSNSEITIPFTLNSAKSFIGIIGKIIFHWIDIRNNNNNLLNTFETILPEIELKDNNLLISYSTSDRLVGKNPFELKVKISNLAREFKKVTFIIDNSTNFMICGPVKKKILIYPNNFKELTFYLIPLYFGNLKLPSFKVIEESVNSVIISESDKNSNYFIPDFIKIKPVI